MLVFSLRESPGFIYISLVWKLLNRSPRLRRCTPIFALRSLSLLLSDLRGLLPSLSVYLGLSCLLLSLLLARL